MQEGREGERERLVRAHRQRERRWPAVPCPYNGPGFATGPINSQPTEPRQTYPVLEMPDSDIQMLDISLSVSLCLSVSLSPHRIHDFTSLRHSFDAIHQPPFTCGTQIVAFSPVLSAHHPRWRCQPITTVIARSCSTCGFLSLKNIK